MYCVRCGVRLQDGIEKCPLCATPVWNPDTSDIKKKQRLYPENYPNHYREETLFYAISMTVLSVLAELMVIFVCYGLYGEMRWGGYVIFGVPLLYCISVLPLWFKEPNPVVFVPCDFAAAALYTLYICMETGGSWYLSFALPLIAVCCLLATAMVCLMRYIRGNRLYIFGGFFILLGGISIFAEFLSHITFGRPMFRWSQFSSAPCVFFGMFLILCNIIKPMRRFLDKKFFY